MKTHHAQHRVIICTHKEFENASRDIALFFHQVSQIGRILINNVLYARCQKRKRTTNKKGGTRKVPYVHHSRIPVHTRKRCGERSSGELRFSKEILLGSAGSHFPGGLARSDSSLVFRRDFIAEKSAFKRGRLQVATASRTRSPDSTRVHVYVCVRVYASATRHFAVIFTFFFLLSG